LEEAEFGSANTEHCSFENCAMPKALFVQASSQHANFSKANLSMAIFQRAKVITISNLDFLSKNAKVYTYGYFKLKVGAL
jgi:uncharacterized protein YjbI with pentapeptide repeats